MSESSYTTTASSIRIQKVVMCPSWVAAISANLTACHAQHRHGWGLDFAQQCQEESWSEKANRLHDLQKEVAEVCQDWQLRKETLPKFHVRRRY